ncbi:MAG: sigma-54-dependent Fis family transcriptional regulator [Deltaproteobacteria bacterium]|nr:sigma-54-dependent Fis family transcriptional regulator [Deltaproteobacteria bacterium]
MEHELDGVVLVVDDEVEHGRSVCRVLERAGARTLSATSGPLALEILRREAVDVVLTDLMMPGMSGRDLITAVKTLRPEAAVILMTAYGTIETAVEAMREGAYDFIEKPLKSARVVAVVARAMERQALRRENTKLKRDLEEIVSLSRGARPIVGRSPAMLETMELAQQAAPSTASVLIVGESGTGKELVARAIHEGSPRKERPLVAVNCAALPESILEAELFGYERGAFTGASERKEGRIERAQGGTLFLDEVSEMSQPVQAKLLRVLQEGEIDRLGGAHPVKVDFRLVAATNRDLEALVKDGVFREDLFYRINVIQIRLAPLRERPEDIPLLAGHFARLYATKNQKPIDGIDTDALDALRRYRWPGNVRELENVIERAVVLSKSRGITLSDLPGPVQTAAAVAVATIRKEGERIVIPVGSKMEDVERALIRATLEATGGDKSLAAQLLGIAPRTIYRRLEAERTHKDPDQT